MCTVVKGLAQLNTMAKSNFRSEFKSLEPTLSDIIDRINKLELSTIARNREGASSDFEALDDRNNKSNHDDLWADEIHNFYSFDQQLIQN